MYNFSYVFWIGDLNFRIDEVPKKEIEDRISKKDYEYLWQFDQVHVLQWYLYHLAFTFWIYTV